MAEVRLNRPPPLPSTPWVCCAFLTPQPPAAAVSPYCHKGPVAVRRPLLAPLIPSFLDEEQLSAGTISSF